MAYTEVSFDSAYVAPNDTWLIAAIARPGGLRRRCLRAIDLRMPGSQRQSRGCLVLQNATYDVEVNRLLAIVTLVLSVRVAQASRVRTIAALHEPGALLRYIVGALVAA